MRLWLLEYQGARLRQPKILAISILTLLCLLVVGCTDERQVRADLMKDCSSHYQAKSFLVAIKTCEIAAESGLAEAQWLLGHIYFYDLAEKGAQPELAFSWYLRAAETGLTKAQTLVGGAYLNAQGVTADYAKAYEWLSRAAEKGDPEAEFFLGMLYVDGKGKAKDISAAISWFKKAANKEHSMSINNLAWIYATSENKAFRSAKKALYWGERLELDGANRSIFLDTKAAAFALAGQFEEAIKAQSDAIASLPEDVVESRLLEFQKRLETYQNQQSWRE